MYSLRMSQRIRASYESANVLDPSKDIEVSRSGTNLDTALSRAVSAVLSAVITVCGVLGVRTSATLPSNSASRLHCSNFSAR